MSQTTRVLIFWSYPLSNKSIRLLDGNNTKECCTALQLLPAVNGDVYAPKVLRFADDASNSDVPSAGPSFVFHNNMYLITRIKLIYVMFLLNLLFNNVLVIIIRCWKIYLLNDITHSKLNLNQLYICYQGS